MPAFFNAISNTTPTRKQFLLPLVLLMLVLLTFATSWAKAEKIAIPPLSGRVTDLTQTLSAEQVKTLSQKLAQLEKSKGSQIAVLMIPTTGDESIEQYSIRLADEWKIGRKGVADGVILLIAKQDKRLRIEVGRGLEGALPDVTAGRIVREVIRPLFKQNDFYGGINAGVDKIVAVIDGEALPPPPASKGHTSSYFSDGIFGLHPLFWIALLIAGLVSSKFIHPWLGRGGAGAGGVVAALVGGATLGTSLLVGAGFLLLLTLLASRFFWEIAEVLLRIGFSGGFGGGGNDRFSGGGGDFGGGGASGDW